jgi:hypothetical protein
MWTNGGVPRVLSTLVYPSPYDNAMLIPTFVSSAKGAGLCHGSCILEETTGVWSKKEEEVNWMD